MRRTEAPVVRHDGWFLAACAIVASALTWLARPGEPTGPDIAAYGRIAEAIRADPGYLLDPAAFDGNFWSPGYPSLLAVLWHATGSLTGVTIVQSLLAGVLVFVPWLLTRHLPGPTRRIGPAILAISPALWGMGTSIGYEVVLAAALGFSLAVAWNLTTFPPATKRRAGALAMLAGLLLAAALLLQTKSLVVLPVVLWLLWKAGPRALAWGAAGSVAGLLPWMVRNAAVLGAPSPFAGNGPYNLWVGNNPMNPSGGSMLVAPPTPGGQDQLSAALEFIVSQPERVLELSWSKAARLLQPAFAYPELIPVGPARTAVHLLAGAIAALLAVGVLAYLGARLMGGPRAVPELTPPAVFVGLFFASHLPLIAEPRFMSAVLPVSSAVATTAWVAIAGRLRRGHS